MKGFLTQEQLAELLLELRVERYAKNSDRIKDVIDSFNAVF
jgi:hypothetical protein